jgi:hypothetical protein
MMMKVVVNSIFPSFIGLPMLFVLSPAKALDYESPLPFERHTQPLMVAQAQGLIDLLAPMSALQIAQLMSLSSTLAELNVARYQAWQPHFSPDNARPAMLAFNGDVYDGLQARTLDHADWDWAQTHVRMLSGLYGVLRPLDLMQPYRLEMGTRLHNPKGGNLYRYWGSQLAQHLNACAAQEGHQCLVNLASEEYFKAIDLQALQVPVVQCVFEEHRGQDVYKVISFMAKRARGMMLRHAIKHKARSMQDLATFAEQGYAYCESVSTPSRWVFRREG